jgi:hypothetical protein
LQDAVAQADRQAAAGGGSSMNGEVLGFLHMSVFIWPATCLSLVSTPCHCRGVCAGLSIQVAPTTFRHRQGNKRT